MKRSPYLPPLRGGIKGGVNPVPTFRSAGHLHRRFSPPSFPPRWGGRPGERFMTGAGTVPHPF